MTMQNSIQIPFVWRIGLIFTLTLLLVEGPGARGVLDQLFSVQRAERTTRESSLRLATIAAWEPWRDTLLQEAGEIALRSGDYQQAIDLLIKADQSGRLDLKGQLLLGEALWQTKDYDKASFFWEALRTQKLLPAENYHRLVWLHRERAEIEQAAYLAVEWLESYPVDPNAAYQATILQAAILGNRAELAFASLELLDSSRAFQLNSLRKALMPTDSQQPQEYHLVQVGRELGNLAEWDLALWDFEKAKSLSHNYAEAWAFAGVAREELKQNGLPDLRKAVEFSPSSATIQALFGYYLRQNGQPELALERFIEATELEPEQPLWQFELGSTYSDLHDVQKGLEAYKKGVALKPDNPKYWILLAQYCLDHNLEVRAIGLAAARYAATLAPAMPEAFDMLGQVMAWLEDFISAERFLQQALDKDPLHPSSNLHLGQLYLRQGRYTEARYHLSLAARGVDRDPQAGLLAQRLLARYFSAR